MPEQASEQIAVQVDEPFLLLVQAEDLAAAALATLASVNRPDGELSIVVTDDETMINLNHQYRHLAEPTDVLSFAAQDADPRFIAAPGADHYLGDVVIAYPYAAQQAGQEMRPVSDELRLLTIHGMLHLLGYDHDGPEQEALMWAKQDSILKSLP